MLKRSDIELEGNAYVIKSDDGEDYLAYFDRSKFGDQVAKKLAETYVDGFNTGWTSGMKEAIGIVKEYEKE